MGWTIWLILAVAFLGFYLLGLLGYRLYLNLTALKKEIDKTEHLVTEAKQFEELPIAKAKANDSEDLAKVLLNRRRIQSEKEDRRQARQRRLVQRISEIEIDKR